MSDFGEKYKKDLSRYSGGRNTYLRRWHYLFRKVQTSNGLNKKIFHFLFILHSEKHAMEISCECKIGSGLYIGHPFNITINQDASLGENCNIHKGVLIGQQNRGDRKGAPVIGNKVWIGINSIIVGKITIGDDVLIAPGSYVNCDVPSHSIVIGNPCKIIHKDDATFGYINNI